MAQCLTTLCSELLKKGLAMNYELSRMCLADFQSADDFIFAELSHRINPVVGWVCNSPDNSSKWGFFKIAAEQIGYSLRAEKMTITDETVYELIESYVFPVVHKWLDNPADAYISQLSEVYKVIAYEIIN